MKKISLFILLFGLFFTIGITKVNGVENTEGPIITTYDQEVLMNSELYVHLEAKNFKNVSGLEILLSYDDTLMTYKSANVEGINSNSTSDIDSSVKNKIMLRSIEPNGMNGNGRIWNVKFLINSNITPGIYKMSFAIGDAYDNQLNNITIATKEFNVTIKERPTYVDEIVMKNTVSNSIYKDEITTVNFYSDCTYGFASTVFEINYDSEILELQDVNLNNELTSVDGALWSINKDIKGYIKITYVAKYGVRYSISLVSCTFKALVNKATQTNVSLEMSETYNRDLEYIKVKGTSGTINLLEKEEVIKKPLIKLESFIGYKEEFYVNIFADTNIKLGAGDFIINYDQTLLEFLSVDKVDTNSMIVVNPNNKEGQVKFSYINENGLKPDGIIAKIKFKPNKCVLDTSLNITGNNLVDDKLKDLVVDYEGSIVKINHKEEIIKGYDSTYEKTGLTDGKKCAFCGTILEEQQIIPVKQCEFKIDSAFLQIDQDIDLIYRTTIPSEYSNPYMKFVFMNKEYIVKDYVKDSLGRYCFRFANLLPQYMIENIDAYLYADYNGEIVQTQQLNYSVKKYCSNLIKRLNYNNASEQTLYTLLSDLLVYGEKTQKYISYKLDNLATSGVDIKPSSSIVLDETYNKLSFEGNVNQNVKWDSAGLHLENKMALKIKFKVDSSININNLKIKVKINNREVILNSSDFILEEPTIYAIYFHGIYATEYNDIIKASFIYNDELIGNILNYSVNTYIYNKQNTEIVKLNEVIKAIFNYGKSANKYQMK